MQAWWWSSKVAVIEDAPWFHRAVWIITAVGITIVSQTFTYQFVKETLEVVREGAKHENDVDVKRKDT